MYIIEQTFFTALYARRLQRRNNGCRINVFFLCFLAIFSIVFQLGFAYEENALDQGTINNSYIVLSSFVFCSFVSVIMVPWVYSVARVSISEAVYCATLAYLSEHSAYCIRIIVADIIGNAAADRYEGLILFLSLVIFGIISDRAFAKNMIHNEHYTTRIKETAGLLIVAVLVVMAFSIFASRYEFTFYHAVYAMTFCITTLLAQLERQRALVMQEESDVRQQLLVTQNRQYESYRENVELVNRKCHDLKHQLAAIRSMGNPNAALKEIEDTVMIYDSFIKTGNEGLDTILTQKNHVCIENDILFTCIADGEGLDFMDAIDMFTLFGNLMDNAIEAVSVLKKEKRSISLSVTNKLNMLIISEENPCENIRLEGGKFKTTKEDEANHGFGLRSMQLVSEKYDGSLSAGEEDGMFKLSIAIPLDRLSENLTHTISGPRFC